MPNDNAAIVILPPVKVAKNCVNPLSGLPKIFVDGILAASVVGLRAGADIT